MCSDEGNRREAVAAGALAVVVMYGATHFASFTVSPMNIPSLTLSPCMPIQQHPTPASTASALRFCAVYVVRCTARRISSTCPYNPMFLAAWCK
jgi:hypothetical protein